jgi:hypothetical protein
MWIKKDEQELISINKKYKINWILYSCIFFSLFIFVFFLIKFSGIGTKQGITISEPLTWQESIKQIPVDICFTLLLTLIVHFSLKNNEKTDKQTVICDKCNAVSKSNVSNKCHCGGELFNIDLMKWIEDDEIKKKVKSK